MVTLASSVINRVLRKFQSSDTPDILSIGIGASDTTLTYQGFLPSLGPGTVIAVDEERILVTAVDQNNKVATVVRGYDNTTAASHSAGALILAKPRGDRQEVLSLINDCLNDLFPDLFKVDTEEFSYSTSSIGYAIPAEAYRILEVTARTSSKSDLWETILDWDNIDNADTDAFGTGRAIMLRASLPTDAIVRVKYGTSFTPVTSESNDLEADSGLSAFMTDLPYYYALSRLLPAEEQLRSKIEAAENHQRAQDVPGFLALRTGEWYAARYQDRKLAAVKSQAFISKMSIGSGYGT